MNNHWWRPSERSILMNLRGKPPTFYKHAACTGIWQIVGMMTKTCTKQGSFAKILSVGHDKIAEGGGVPKGPPINHPTGLDLIHP